MKPWHKLTIGIAGSIFILCGLAFWPTVGLRHVLYPPAPAMPAIVSEPMPEILSRLDAVLKTNAPHVFTELQPGISTAQIKNLETQYHVRIPDEIKGIYEWHNGSAALTNRLADFIPVHRFLPLEEALAARTNTIVTANAPLIARVFYYLFAGYRNSWVCLFDDGAGDGYWYDLDRKPSEGAVFSDFTEDASYTFFPSPKNMMAGITDCYEHGAFHTKKGSSPPELEEDFEQSAKIWTHYSVSP